MASLIGLFLACLTPPPDAAEVDWDGDGYAADDCDDDDAAIHPGATEVCDQVDRDCDGPADCPMAASDGTMLLGVEPGGNAGVSVAGLGDLDGDGYGELLVGASGLGEDDHGGAYLVYGPMARGSQTGLDTAAARFLSDDRRDFAGSQVRGLPVNGDRLLDVVVTRRDADTNFPGGLSIWLSSPEARFSGDYLLSEAPLILEGRRHTDNTGEQLGIDLAGAGSECLIGAMYHTEIGPRARPYQGGAYLLAYDALPASGVVPDVGALARARVFGERSSDLLGTGVLAAEVDNLPGIDYLFAAAGTANRTGTIYVFQQGATLVGAVPADAADAAWTGTAEGSALGLYGSMTALPDTDGDGLSDVLAGEQSADGGGAIYFVPSRRLLASGAIATLASVAWYGAPGDGLFTSAAADFDDDQVVDIAIVVPGADKGGVDVGSVSVFFGPPSPGQLSLADADLRFVGDAAVASEGGSQLGSSVQVVPDLDGDGMSDILVGAANQTTPAGPGAGSVYVLFAGGF